MKTTINKIKFTWLPVLALCMLFSSNSFAQKKKKEAKAKTETSKRPTVKPVKNTFDGIWLMDNQTVMVPVKKTFEIDIMHRFGIIDKGIKDFFGMFAPANIRLGLNYVPVKNLLIGASLTKTNMTVEGYAKYSIIRQTPGRYPVSVTYYGDIALDTREHDAFFYKTDRFMFFNQLLIARKLTSKLSAQAGISQTHVNIVPGYFYAPGKYKGTMQNDHFALALSGRYKIKEGMGVMLNWDQPLTKHLSNNPAPNVSFGLELTTSAHSFQFFAGNYYYMTPSRNNYFNNNDPSKKQFLIGFNITRLWNY
jgi:hypothetical protein